MICMYHLGECSSQQQMDQNPMAFDFLHFYNVCAYSWNEVVQWFSLFFPHLFNFFDFSEKWGGACVWCVLWYSLFCFEGRLIFRVSEVEILFLGFGVRDFGSSVINFLSFCWSSGFFIWRCVLSGLFEWLRGLWFFLLNCFVLCWLEPPISASNFEPYIFGMPMEVFLTSAGCVLWFLPPALLWLFFVSSVLGTRWPFLDVPGLLTVFFFLKSLSVSVAFSFLMTCFSFLMSFVTNFSGFTFTSTCIRMQYWLNEVITSTKKIMM